MPADADFTPASDPRNPIPVRIDVACNAALHVAADAANRVVVLRLAAEPDARLYLTPEGARILGALLTGRGALPVDGGRAMSPRTSLVVGLAIVGMATRLFVTSLEAELAARGINERTAARRTMELASHHQFLTETNPEKLPAFMEVAAAGARDRARGARGQGRQAAPARRGQGGRASGRRRSSPRSRSCRRTRCTCCTTWRSSGQRLRSGAIS
jgi:hypothetical protein